MTSLPNLSVVVFLIGCVGCWAQGGFNEEFDAPRLDPRWEWRTPKPGPTVSLTEQPGHLRITLPQVERGYNHWVGDHGTDAPMLLAPASKGDFFLDTHLRLVSFAPESNFHLALIVAFSSRYVVGWGPFFAPVLGNPRERPEVWCEPTGQARYLVETGDASDVHLRIERRGREYIFSLRRAEDAPWVECGRWSSPWPPQYVGFMGKTFGDGPAVVADLDYIRLQVRESGIAQPLEATVRVDVSGPSWPLNPLRFGHFIEHLGRCIYGGIWAEMLHNRKFTGRVSEAGVVEGWEPVGLREGIWFDRDNVNFYCPSQSQRIELGAKGEPAGVGQGGLRLRGGVGYQVRLVARQEGLRTPVHVTLEGEQGLVSRAEVTDIGENGTVRELTLAGPTAPTEARFAITTEGPGTLWIGAVSLMPADNVDGMRADVLEAIREISPPIVRWPGGNFVSGYDWRDGIGERDRRPPRWDRAWNAWEWNDFGTDEFMRFCQLVGAQPYICANAGEGMAREAADWVEYCNGPAESRWGSVRASLGHPEPYDVRVWGLGNEMYGDWQLGHLSATNYGLKAVEMARAMRAVDPTIQLVGVGVDADGWGGWNREVCRIAGPYMEWLSVHYYLGARVEDDPILTYMNEVGAPAQVERMLMATHQIAEAATGRPIPLAFDEWNVWTNTHAYSLREGLFACLIFHALHRLGDRCPMANLAQLVNMLGAIYTDQTRVVRTPVHLAFRLYTRGSGAVGVPVEVQAPVTHFSLGGELAALDAVASLSHDARTLYVAVVNRMPADSVETRLELSGFHAADAVQVTTLNAPTPESANTFEEPQAVGLTETTVPLREALEYTFPAHSATVMVFRAR